jgi:hypothetical protein
MTIVLLALATTLSVTVFLLVSERNATNRPVTPARRRGQSPSPRPYGKKEPAGR